jgi:hypothetical protein
VKKDIACHDETLEIYCTKAELDEIQSKYAKHVCLCAMRGWHCPAQEELIRIREVGSFHYEKQMADLLLALRQIVSKREPQIRDKEFSLKEKEQQLALIESRHKYLRGELFINYSVSFLVGVLFTLLGLAIFSN